MRTDDTDQVRAKANVSEMLVGHPDVAALVGLVELQRPGDSQCRPRRRQDRQVKIIAFDEDDETLTGVKAGAIVGTVVQQPYEFGYQAITLLAKALEGDRSGIPASRQVFIPTMVIRQNNVDEFRTKLDAAARPLTRARPDAMARRSSSFGTSRSGSPACTRCGA